ncbi:MAG: hypothetical protein ABSE77_21170 [Acidimicrobiales bacterium]
MFDELAVEGFRALPRDNEWLLGVALASEARSGLRDAERAAVLYQQLEPFERRHALGNPEGSLGAICRYLGLLAQTLGSLDQAEHHLRTAIALNERMGARPWVAHSRFDLARVLSQRDGPGDRELALLELSLAQDICRELGMPALGEKAAKLLGDRPADGAREPSGQGRRVFRKEGEYWTVVFGTDAFRLKDIKGLTYLAQLLGHPGRELHVLDHRRPRRRPQRGCAHPARRRRSAPERPGWRGAGAGRTS